MKKYQYIVAIACVLVGAVGFAGMYAYDQAQKKEQENKPPVVENTQSDMEDDRLAAGDSHSGESESDPEPVVDSSQVADSETENSADEQEPVDDTPVGTVEPEKLHFQPEKGLVWPVNGPTLLDYSMDGTIFFPTLKQYQYNPAMIIGADVNDKVYFLARGKITKIETNEETGCTVTQDLGDGYTAIYGQLKELNFDEGDMVESGQVVGFISEPTKYYAVEGPSVYLQILKDGVPIDPEELFAEE